MPSYILALDQGTTSSRALVFDHGGAVQAVAQREFRQFYPRPGWVEHDASEIWETQLRVATVAIEESGIEPSDLAAIGITNQRETVVAWDRSTHRPLSNAIVWQDRRTASMCDRLRAEKRERLIRNRTGLLIDPYFSGTKYAWLLENVAPVRKAADSGRLALGTIDSWLVYKLTGGAVHVTDASNASRTMLYDIRADDWDEELLEMLGVPRDALPEVRSSSEVYGESMKSLGLGSTPVAGMAGDQQAALAGQLCFEKGTAKNTYGTGCFALLNTGTSPAPSKHNLLTTVAWKLGDEITYALEGSVFVAGAVVQWLRDGLRIIETAADVNRLASTVEDNGGVYFVPAFAGLGAPHWDPYARGTIVGLTRGTEAGHIARAALEGIAFQVADVLDAMRADAGDEITELRVDGGAAASDFLMQFQSDILGLPLVRPKILETTALGAACLAGLAVDFWASPLDLMTSRDIDRKFEPQMPDHQALELRGRWQSALKRARGWAQSEV